MLKTKICSWRGDKSYNWTKKCLRLKNILKKRSWKFNSKQSNHWQKTVSLLWKSKTKQSEMWLMSCHLMSIWSNSSRYSPANGFLWSTSQKTNTSEFSWTCLRMKTFLEVLFTYLNFCAVRSTRLNTTKLNHQETPLSLRFKKYWFRRVFLNCWLKWFTYFLSLSKR